MSDTEDDRLLQVWIDAVKAADTVSTRAGKRQT